MSDIGNKWLGNPFKNQSVQCGYFCSFLCKPNLSETKLDLERISVSSQMEFCFTKINGAVKPVIVALSTNFYFFRILFWLAMYLSQFFVQCCNLLATSIIERFIARKKFCKAKFHLVWPSRWTPTIPRPSPPTTDWQSFCAQFDSYSMTRTT